MRRYTLVAVDLLETITTWRNIYSTISAPVETRNSYDEQFHEKWNRGMLKVVAALDIIDELKNTPVEKHMLKAIEDGRAHDEKRLDDIYVLLGEVEKYLIEKVAS
jgi:hypothetical protein